MVLHESNAIPGRVTRLLGRFCSAVAIGLPAAAKRIPGSQPVLTGTPVRSSFLAPQPLPGWVPSGEGAATGGDGRQSRRSRAQPNGACRGAGPVGAGLPRGSPHRRQRPRPWAAAAPTTGGTQLQP